MKPQHAKEAAQIVEKYEQIQANIIQLGTCSSIITMVCGRNINIDNRSKTFGKIREALIELEHQSLAQLVRRGNQIGLHL